MEPRDLVFKHVFVCKEGVVGFPLAAVGQVASIVRSGYWTAKA